MQAHVVCRNLSSCIVLIRAFKRIKWQLSYLQYVFSSFYSGYFCGLLYAAAVKSMGSSCCKNGVRVAPLDQETISNSPSTSKGQSSNNAQIKITPSKKNKFQPATQADIDEQRSEYNILSFPTLLLINVSNLEAMRLVCALAAYCLGQGNHSEKLLFLETDENHLEFEQLFVCVFVLFFCLLPS